jgi:hypothetical protein
MKLRKNLVGCAAAALGLWAGGLSYGQMPSTAAAVPHGSSGIPRAISGAALETQYAKLAAIAARS